MRYIKKQINKKTNCIKFPSVFFCPIEATHWSRCQFHQHSTSTYFVRTSFRQLFFSYMYVEKRRWYEQFVRLTLMKLTLGVNFTKILRVPFSTKAFSATLMCLQLTKRKKKNWHEICL